MPPTGRVTLSYAFPTITIDVPATTARRPPRRRASLLRRRSRRTVPSTAVSTTRPGRPRNHAGRAEKPDDDDDRPHRGHADPVAERQPAYHDSVSMPYSKLKAHMAEILRPGGITPRRGPSPDAKSARPSRDAEVRPQPGRRSPASGASAARAAVYASRQSAARARRAVSRSCRRPRPARRPAGQREACRRGSPRLRLVTPGPQGGEACPASADAHRRATAST